MNFGVCLIIGLVSTLILYQIIILVFWFEVQKFDKAVGSITYIDYSDAPFIWSIIRDIKKDKREEKEMQLRNKKRQEEYNAKCMETYKKYLKEHGIKDLSE